MSDKEKAVKNKDKEDTTATTEEVTGLPNAKKKGSEWTVDRCIKAAKRFANAQEWKDGAPASYKSAEAHGWIPQCSKHFNKNKTETRKPQPRYQKTA